MVLHRSVVYQVAYMGSENTPEFIDLSAKDDQEAEKEAGEWSIRNASWLREQGNTSVRLIKTVREFGLPDID